MTTPSVKEDRWRAALDELRAAFDEYGSHSPEEAASRLGEGTEALAWLRVRRAVDEYERARDDLCREAVIDQ